MSFQYFVLSPGVLTVAMCPSTALARSTLSLGAAAVETAAMEALSSREMDLTASPSSLATASIVAFVTPNRVARMRRAWNIADAGSPPRRLERVCSLTLRQGCEPLTDLWVSCGRSREFVRGSIGLESVARSTILNVLSTPLFPCSAHHR